LVTPFNSDLSIDHEALTNIVNYNIENGTDYLVICGTTGESVTLTKQEKKDVVATISKANNGRLPLVLGIGGLFAQLPHAKFQFLSANYDFSNTIMNTHTKPYQIFKKSGIKIGVFGLGIELDGLVAPKMFKETKYLNPIEISQDMSRILKKEEKCDLVICLSHLGYHYRNSDKISDLILAKATKDIDLIIGGHTHTFLPKPTVIKNSENKNVLINQVGCYGINLGKIDFYLDSDKNKSANGTSIIV
jgi:5'-nucleotidase